MAARRPAALLSSRRRDHRLRDVLADVDSSIRAWLAAELSPGTEIGFDPPGLLSTIARRPRRAAIVNLFLYAITENLDGMPAGPVRLRNADGRVTATIAPARSYHLSYLVTAWAADVAEEHELLGAVIGAHAERDVLGGDHLRGSLRAIDPLPIRLGWSPGSGRQEMWSALGLPMRTAVELTVTAPALPSRLKPVAPPVEAIELEMYDTDRDHDQAVADNDIPRRRWERTTITEH